MRIAVFVFLLGATRAEYAGGNDVRLLSALSGSLAADSIDIPQSLAVRRALAILDRNGDSLVTTDDIRQFVNETGMDPAMSKEFPRLDRNGDGVLDLAELTTGLATELLAVSMPVDSAPAMQSSVTSTADPHVPLPAKVVKEISANANLLGALKLGNPVSLLAPLQPPPEIHVNPIVPSSVVDVQPPNISSANSVAMSLGPRGKTALTAVSSADNSGNYDQIGGDNVLSGLNRALAKVRSRKASQSRVTTSESKANELLDQVKKLEEQARSLADKATEDLVAARASASEANVMYDTLTGSSMI
jgi:hypothetical protein